MSSKNSVQFPDVGNKLQAPTKKSVFERQKAEAEAKRLREEAETKAVYDDFVKSFDDEDESPRDGFGRREDSGFGAGQGGRLGGFPGAQSKRYFTQGAGIPTGPASGRGFGAAVGRGGSSSGIGSLGSVPGSVGRKRPYEGFAHTGTKREDRGLLNFEDYDESTLPSKLLSSLDTDDDQNAAQSRAEERAVPKPTLRLASLPPATSPAFIKALLPPNLTVDAVKILPATASGVTTERKSMSAIVTLAKDTPANDIDAAVNTLQNKYLGFGYYLNLHRHLSSAALSSSAPVTGLSSTTSAQPFGAKPVVLPTAGRGQAPPNHQRGFAPPTSYGPSPAAPLNRNLLCVPVQAPRDIRELKLIHKVIEALIKHGPEFEALLMSRPDVQREERWAWLWDPRSAGGVWYRWRLWEVLTGSQTRRGQGKYLPLFEGSSAWKSPAQPLAFEYTTRLEEFVSDSEYNSSDDEESGDEGARRPNHNLPGAPPDPASALADDGKAYLNPLEKAKLTHLIARLPTSTGRLRKGDVARVTAFAISHAGQGADEIVSMILSNIMRPFSYTSANPDRRREKENSGDETNAVVDDEEQSDTSSASLIGLYLISDILSSSSTSGVRHAWRYRQLFEAALKRRRVFEMLGRMEGRMGWGKLRAEKWKRSVGNVLSLWEGWCVFPTESQESFVTVFNSPPLTEQEEAEAREKEVAVEEKDKSRWKAVEVAAKELNADAQSAGAEEPDLDGEPMDEDDDIDGVPMSDEASDIDGDGQPMDEDMNEAAITEDNEMEDALASASAGVGLDGIKVDEKAEIIPAKASLLAAGQTRRRPKAIDMFADSDNED